MKWVTAHIVNTTVFNATKVHLLIASVGILRTPDPLVVIAFVHTGSDVIANSLFTIYFDSKFFFYILPVDILTLILESPLVS